MRIIRSIRSLSSGAEKDGSVVLVGSIDMEIELALVAEHDDGGGDDEFDDDLPMMFGFRDALPGVIEADEIVAVASQNSDRRDWKLLLLDMVVVW